MPSMEMMSESLVETLKISWYQADAAHIADSYLSRFYDACLYFLHVLEEVDLKGAFSTLNY
jgi:hypothetical protein